MKAITIIIAEDGTFTNGDTAEVLTLKQVIAEARTRREAGNEAKAKVRAAQKVERKAAKKARLEARKAKVEAELAALSA